MKLFRRSLALLATLPLFALAPACDSEPASDTTGSAGSSGTAGNTGTAGSGGQGGTGGQGGASTGTTGGGTAGGATTSAGGQGGTGGQGGATTGTTGGGGAGGGNPGVPFGGSSKGSGGPAPVAGQQVQGGGINYYLIVPGAPQKPAPLLIVYSGVEGGAQMTNNLKQVGAFTGIDKFICAVLDGKVYNGNADAGATVLDDVRSHYDIDNDRTYLLGESAGTTAALKLGFELRQEYFAAYWANDVNATGKPAKTAAELGFAPWGQVGPGGQQATADAIVSAMKDAGYKLPNPAPYAGKGADQHGSPDQFLAAVSWFPGKTRQ